MPIFDRHYYTIFPSILNVLFPKEDQLQSYDFRFNAATKVYKLLESAYTEPHRRYHSLDHIIDMLRMVEKLDSHDCAQEGSASNRAFQAAILFHDIVYDPRRYAPDFQGHSNEQESAILCQSVLKENNVPKEIIDRAVQLILMTEKHIVPDTDIDAALFMDIDMSILGSPLERYEQYARGTAQEFLSVFTPEQYQVGRSQFLTAWYNREQPIFKTDGFKPLEGIARRNMAWELENLNGIVGTPRQSPIPPHP